MSVPRFHVPDARDGARVVSLPDDEAHHLRHVLRLETGAEVVVFDGDGHEWRGRAAEVGKHGVHVALGETLVSVAEPVVKITLGIGMLKGDQVDAVVRDATMLGASVIAPFVSEHVAVTPRAWQRDGAIERWRRVAVSSAKQCRRALVPRIEPTQSLADLLDAWVGRTIVAAVEPRASRRHEMTLDREAPMSALALVGPEGGWSASEIDLLARRGAVSIQLGPRTLRAETAPTVLLSVLWTTWGW